MHELIKPETKMTMEVKLDIYLGTFILVFYGVGDRTQHSTYTSGALYC